MMCGNKGEMLEKTIPQEGKRTCICGRTERESVKKTVYTAELSERV
jgi:hypothetical protein